MSTLLSLIGSWQRVAFMNNFYLAFFVVCPLFLMMALGYFLKVIEIFNDRLLKELNALCFKVFLPLILFINVYKTDISQVFNLKLVVFSVSSICLCFIVLMGIVPLFEKENKKRGVLVQGIFRSNFILFGIPIAVSLFGNEYIGLTAVLIVFIIPVFNILSVIALEVFDSEQTNIKNIIKGIILNPLIIGSAIALFFLITGIKLPNVLEKTVSDISMIATPLALIVLGGSFKVSKLSKLSKNVIPLSMGVIAKLVIVPMVLIPVSVLCGFRGPELGALMALYTSPTAVSSFIMAEQMNGDSELAGQIVAISSIVSILTIFIWIVILKQSNYM